MKVFSTSFLAAVVPLLPQLTLAWGTPKGNIIAPATGNVVLLDPSNPQLNVEILVGDGKLLEDLPEKATMKLKHQVWHPFGERDVTQVLYKSELEQQLEQQQNANDDDGDDEFQVADDQEVDNSAVNENDDGAVADQQVLSIPFPLGERRLRDGKYRVYFDKFGRSGTFTIRNTGPTADNLVKNVFFGDAKMHVAFNRVNIPREIKYDFFDVTTGQKVEGASGEIRVNKENLESTAVGATIDVSVDLDLNALDDNQEYYVEIKMWRWGRRLTPFRNPYSMLYRTGKLTVADIDRETTDDADFDDINNVAQREKKAPFVDDDIVPQEGATEANRGHDLGKYGDMDGLANVAAQHSINAGVAAQNKIEGVAQGITFGSFGDDSAYPYSINAGVAAHNKIEGVAQDITFGSFGDDSAYPYPAEVGTTDIMPKSTLPSDVEEEELPDGGLSEEEINNFQEDQGLLAVRSPVSGATIHKQQLLAASEPKHPSVAFLDVIRSLPEFKNIRNKRVLLKKWYSLSKEVRARKLGLATK